jgi:ATP-binding cassette subfamily B protein
MMFLIQCYSLLIIGAGAILMYYGQATMTDIVTFFLYNRFITHPIFKLVGFTEQFQQGGAAFDRFIEIIEVEPEIKDCDNPICPDEMKGSIEFRNVSFRYNSVDEGEIVLDDVSFQITAGQTIALVGESGAGKSTIAALLPRFYEPESGEILIDGNNIMQLKQEFLRANIGLVQQNVFLFDATIRENIMFGRPDATEDDLIDAAKRANIYDFIMEQTDGFDTLVGEHGVMLSGGQKQRVSIARVFLKNPPILIFDEATSSLDNESEKLIQQSMEDLCKNRTTLVIAHRLTTVRNADYTYVIRRGKIVESGTHNDLIAADGYYCKLHKMHEF